jgi:transcriptional regulator of NAD metabolism
VERVYYFDCMIKNKNYIVMSNEVVKRGEISTKKKEKKKEKKKREILAHRSGG